MTDFLVLHRTGPSPTDFEVCGFFAERKADEGETVIREGMSRGEGEYLAVKLSGSTRRVAATALELSDPEG